MSLTVFTIRLAAVYLIANLWLGPLSPAVAAVATLLVCVGAVVVTHLVNA